MPRIPLLTGAATLAALLAAATPALPQGYGNSYGSPQGRPAAPAASADIGGVLGGFRDGTDRLCANVDPAYRVDCVADYFNWLADRLPASAEFGEAQSIVRNAARQLNQVARQNASRTQAPAVIRQSRSASAKKTSRPVVPVAPERQAAARAAAAAIVQETRTLLLRAAEGPARRKLAFTRIAEAVGESRKILLRST
ncbi:hypothetical protein [Oceaniglobus roseus]|uniref:hypothetical protein n=1 Tax=Oceaniglobus roseus TaxID=1737570 RepID=UPI000C7EA55B|nr:hypothetical protein [Kandeliimicrobium roseum]